MIAKNAYPALVLNADYRPLSYYPLSLWGWQDAITAVFLDKVKVVANYDQIVSGARTAMQLPSVISLKEYVRLSREPALTRFNIFLRDGFACVYCDAVDNLTFDHVLPRSKGGTTTWENTATACSPCNACKADKSLEKSGLTMRRKPYKPRVEDLQRVGKKFPPNYLHESWSDYLYWDAALTP